jgi:Lon protease-like protein
MGAAMNELPLFPLNTVLFPFTPVYLHIFEERYQRMIGECIQKHEPFGVVLIKSGREALGSLAEPFRVGCTAEIVQVEKLSEGRLNIVAMGRDRFRIVELDQKRQPYLVGKVEQFPLKPGQPGKLEGIVQKLRPWVSGYVKLLAEYSEAPAQAQKLPEDPLVFAYLSAAILQSPPVQKQALLEAEDAGAMAASLLNMLRRETAILQNIHEKESGAGKRTFSQN